MHALLLPIMAAVAQAPGAPDQLQKFVVDIGETIEISPGTRVVPLAIIEDRRCAGENGCDFGGTLKVRLTVTEAGKTEERVISPLQRFRVGGGWLFFAGSFGSHGLKIAERDYGPYLLAFTYDPKAMPEPDIRIVLEDQASPSTSN